MPVHHKLRPLLVGLVALALIGACGGDDDSAAPTTTSTTEAAASYPVTVTTPKGDITIEKQPTKIVSLSPSATEVLFAIGAGEQVTAVDDQSNYPASAPKTKLSGFQPNVEAVAGYSPDLVIASNDTGGLYDGLTKLSVPVVISPAAANLDEAYAAIEQLGEITGHPADAAELVADMKADIAKLVERVPAAGATKPTYFHELDNTLYTVTSRTFIGQLYTMAGLVNIADDAQPGNDYPQLSAEALIEADPDFIFLADTKCCGQSAAEVAKRPGYDKLKAVKNGHVVALDDDIASRWGPRVVDLLEAIIDAAWDEGAEEKPAA